jgi:hypothetical protein
MQFALRLRNAWTQASDAETNASRTTAELAPVDLYRLQGREIGWIAPEGVRTSDWLNEERRLDVYRPLPLPIDAVVDWPEPPGKQTSLEWVVRDAADFLFVVPPSLPTNLHLRVHRRVVDISLKVGDWRVWGRAHIRPGAEVGDYLLRGGRHFIPLTGVELLHEADPPLRLQVPVVIVNVSHVTHFEMPDRRNDLRTRQAPPVALVEAPAENPDAPSDFERVIEDLLSSRRQGRITRDEMRAQLEVLLRLS